MKNYKRLMLLPVLVVAVLVPMLMMTACFGGAYSIQGDAPTQEQLVGRWNLTRTEYRPMGVSTNATGGRFVEFRADGTFVENNFWSGNATGTWTLNGHTLVMTLEGTSSGDWLFVANREVGIDGGTLHMVYTRTQGSTWHYRHRFSRA